MADERIPGRINIKYKPGTGNAKEDPELPHVSLVVGDFTGGNATDELADRKPLQVDKLTFAERMRAQNLKLKVVVADRLSGEPDAQLPVELKFNSIQDFHPDAIVQQVEPLKDLVQLRKALQDLRGRYINDEAFRKKLVDLFKDEAKVKSLMDEMKNRSES